MSLLLFFDGGDLDPTRRYTGVFPTLFYAEALAALRYVVNAAGGKEMPEFPILPPVAPSQKQTVALDFGNFLPAGVTLTGDPTLNFMAKGGVDPDPSSRVTGGPAVGTAAVGVGGTGKVNTAVLFQVYECLPNVTYLVEVVCDRSDGDVAEGYTLLPCFAPG